MQLDEGLRSFALLKLMRLIRQTWRHGLMTGEW